MYKKFFTLVFMVFLFGGVAVAMSRSSMSGAASMSEGGQEEGRRLSPLSEKVLEILFGYKEHQLLSQDDVDSVFAEAESGRPNILHECAWCKEGDFGGRYKYSYVNNDAVRKFFDFLGEERAGQLMSMRDEQGRNPYHLVMRNLTIKTHSITSGAVECYNSLSIEKQVDVKLRNFHKYLNEQTIMEAFFMKDNDGKTPIDLFYDRYWWYIKSKLVKEPTPYLSFDVINKAPSLVVSVIPYLEGRFKNYDDFVSWLQERGDRDNLQMIFSEYDTETRIVKIEFLGGVTVEDEGSEGEGSEGGLCSVM